MRLSELAGLRVEDLDFDQDVAGVMGKGRAAAVTGPASLTGREREVARLAAQGHTVRQIAERLSISQRTVETYLANVYAKLGVAAKADLVGRAAKLEMEANP